MQLLLEVKEKTFKTKEGDTRTFIDCEVEINEKKFSLFPRTEDKKLFNYLVKQELGE